MKDESKAAPAPQKRSVLYWRDVKRTSAPVFAGACAREKWAADTQTEPSEVTEADYDRVVYAVEFERI